MLSIYWEKFLNRVLNTLDWQVWCTVLEVKNPELKSHTEEPDLNDGKFNKIFKGDEHNLEEVWSFGKETRQAERDQQTIGASTEKHVEDSKLQNYKHSVNVTQRLGNALVLDTYV